MVLSPLISLAVKKAADLLIEQVCRMRGLDDKRKKLHRLLQAIQRKIADAEVRGEEWCLEELEAAAHEAVDVLDEFQYEALRQNAITQQSGASAKVIKGFFSHENPAVFRFKMSNKLTKVLEKIEKIVTEMNTFNFTPRDPAAPSIDRETISFVMESDVIGRDSEKEKIVNELMDPQRERDNISVLAIVGMGGLGKTTLAQLVFNDERVKGHFELLLWVCVSTEFNVVSVIKSIIEVARNEGDASTFNKEVLQRQLREKLEKKKYLLVLDDVWNEEREKWDELRMLLFSGAGSGSSIIVTTRSKEVASIMGTLPHHDLTSLNEEDSWSLFEKRAFDARVEESREEFIEIGRAIVRKCAGVPLVVKAVGGLMGTKREVHEWRAISENKILDGLQSTGNVLPILELSYHHLPSHIKQCFAFCAIFPQDYEIERETLIQLWMANDFIPTDGSLENLEDKGRYIFNELYWRSFFQNMKETEIYYGLKITCKMHDLMHDLATKIGKNKCSTILEPNSPGIVQKEIHHLSITNKKSPGINNVLKQFPAIHTCLSLPNIHEHEKEKQSYLLKSSCLRALKFPLGCARKELGYMKHIRYLNLSLGRFDILPKTISILYNLQTLELSYSRIRELPTEMRYMINLRHLFLVGCLNLKRMPIGLGQLKCLRTLTNYIVDSGRGGSIKELKNLNLLCGRMSLSRLESVRDWEDAKIVNLAAKMNLCSLELLWGKTDNKRATKNDQEVIEALTPHNKLKTLKIIGYSGSCFPKWMMEALIIRNLKILKLDECINCAELPPLWQLPLLENLYLTNMERLTHIISSMCKHVEGSKSLITFSALKVLKLLYLPNLVSWHEEDSKMVDFPRLTELTIRGCPKLISIPVHVPLLTILSVFNSSKIKLQEVSNLPMLSELHMFIDTPLSEPDAFRPPKNLEVMRIEGFENVNPLEEEENQSCQTRPLRKLFINKSHCFFSCGPSKVPALKFWKYFAALESLGIYECNALVFWPEEEFRSLQCLKNLTIQSCEKFTGSFQVTSLPTPCWEDSLLQLESLQVSGCFELVEVPVSSMSLKQLSLLYCPRIESFHEGLQQRLSSLRYLLISGCPALERHCSQGGIYWHLVSLIPEKEVYI